MRAKQVYDRRRITYRILQAKQQVSATRLSNGRLYTFTIGLVASVFSYRAAGPTIGAAIGLLTLILFGYLAFRHQRVRHLLTYAETLHDINRRGVERATGGWRAFSDTGVDFKDDDHPYASDLDLFGQASLFQWINSTTTSMGRATLARLLKHPSLDRSEILARQAAVTELAGKLAWRQRFEAEGLLASDRSESTEPLLQWASGSHQAYLQPVVKIGVRVLPAVTILTLALYGFRIVVPWQVPTLLIALQGTLLLAYGKERSRVLSMVYRHEERLRTYARMLTLFENQKFDEHWLKVRQDRLSDADGRPAYQQIAELSTIAERIANRQNGYFLALNVLLLWDYQCMIALSEWKERSGKRLSVWLEVLAEIEAISSLANIRFEHPEWAMPSVLGDHSQARELEALSAEKLGHPLITQNRVCNDFEMTEAARIVVVTGSNMSGKSTFLRTVGINLVLAYAGSPVCAEKFRCSLVSLWTSMRTADNLGQSISSFYAEILRIKRIVDAAAGTERRVFCLLDEVFKGTNSYDRHQGARALIAQLRRDGAFGLISTHDLELGELEQESGGRIRNYHFREHYRDHEIYFDYTLRRGVSTTRNALYLIKMMGIRVEDGTPKTVS